MMESTVLQANGRGISTELLHTENHKAMGRCCNCSRISTMHPNPFLYRLHKLYRPALVHEVFGIIYRPTYIDAESETRTCQLYRKRLLYISF
jgi:hypothetical protein